MSKDVLNFGLYWELNQDSLHGGQTVTNVAHCIIMGNIDYILSLFDFSWSDGSPLDYIKWREGEPNDFNGEEECGEIYAASK